MSIKLIGLDLDGTTFNKEKRVSAENRAAIEEALGRGIDVVVSTGRTYTSIPDSLWEIRGLRYVITSNGAAVTDRSTGERIYSSFLDEGVVEKLITLSQDEDIPLEVFCDGKAYVDSGFYHDVEAGGSFPARRKYIMETRSPIDGIYDFMERNSSSLENVNLLFEDMEKKRRIMEEVKKFSPATVTTSVRSNVEIGGPGSSKAQALAALMDRFGVRSEELMCCGDAPNDISMIEFAGVGVAMGNAGRETKEHADFVTYSNEDDGVAFAIRKFALNEKHLRLRWFFRKFTREGKA
jgi:Cof subfamily protein (haloacid dehalogenase superfamily)